MLVAFFISNGRNNHKRYKTMTEPITTTQQAIEAELTAANPWIVRLSDHASSLGELVHVIVRSTSMMLGVYLIGMWVASVFATWELFHNIELSIFLTAPEALALFSVARFEKIALTERGDTFKKALPVIALINTAFIASLLLLGADFYPEAALMAPLVLGAVSLGFFLAVEANQYKTVIQRRRLMQRGEHAMSLSEQQNAYELAQLTQQNAELQNQIERQNIETSNRLAMDKAAFGRLASDPRMINIQARAVYVTYVTDMMRRLGIHANTKEGKQLLELAREASQQGVNVAPDSIQWPVDTNGISLVDLAQGNTDPN